MALLAINEQAALIGDFAGRVTTKRREPGEGEDHWYQRMRNEGLPIWQRQDVDHEEFDRLLRIVPTDNPNVNNVIWGVARIPFRTYNDPEVGLSADAAFDPVTHYWVVKAKEQSSWLLQDVDEVGL
jgi:hypothetical protein